MKEWAGSGELVDGCRLQQIKKVVVTRFEEDRQPVLRTLF